MKASRLVRRSGVTASCVLLFVHLLSPVLASDSRTREIHADRAEQMSDTHVWFGVGANRAEVLESLGTAGVKISKDCWVYWDFETVQEAGDTSRYNTLVIQFSKDKVAAMKLVDGQTIRAYLAQREPGKRYTEIASVSRGDTKAKATRN